LENRKNYSFQLPPIKIATEFKKIPLTLSHQNSNLKNELFPITFLLMKIADSESLQNKGLIINVILENKESLLH
jgi:hypothetical protein